MSRRLFTAVLLAVVLHGGASCADLVSAEEPEECEPLTGASLILVGARLSLDQDQLRWLAHRLKQGRLRSPADLDEMPGLGPELREALESAWCWSGVRQGHIDLAVRTREDGVQREARLVTEGARVRVEARWRAKPGQESVLRGSISAHRAGWRWWAGSLRARGGLGLLLVTPGAETRGSTPLRDSVSGWRGSLALDPETLTGVAVRRETGTWWTEAALLRGSGTAPGWGSASVGKRLGRTRVRLTWAGGGEDQAWALQMGGDGGWSWEWARGASGGAQGAAWALTEGSWRLRASLTHRDGGYRVPFLRAHRKPPGEEAGQFRLETRWQGGSGRHLRLALAEERGPEVYGVPWTRLQSERVLEFAERVHSRVRAAALWRSRHRRTDGAAPDGDGRERLMRLALRYGRAPWRMDLRVEERSAPGGVARFTSVRLFREGGLSWQLAAGLAALDGDAPDLWWYRRRAGGLYAWDRLGEGAWLGGWARLSRGRAALEMSLVNRSSGWSGGVGLRTDLGRPDMLDPALQHY